MNAPEISHGDKWTIVRTLLCAAMLLIYCVAYWSEGSVAAQEADAATPAAELATIESDSAPTVEPTEAALEPTPSPVTDVLLETSTDETVQGEGEAPPPAPRPPVLSVDPGQTPECRPASGEGAPVLPAGSAVEFTCTYAIGIEASGIALDEIAVDWDIRTLVPDGLSVRLDASATGPERWSDASRGATDWNSDLVDPSAVRFSGVDNAERGTISGLLLVTFSLQIARDACSSIEGAIQIDVQNQVSLPGHSELLIDRSDVVPEPLFIMPVMPAPNPIAPDVTILGVGIEPVRFSLSDQITTGSATIQVRVDEPQCGESNIFVKLTDDIASSPPISLTSVSADGDAVLGFHQSPGQSLDTPVPIGVVSPSTATGFSTLTVSFELTVPGGLAVGVFAVNASAVVVSTSP